MFFLIFENIISSFLLMLFGAKYTSLVGGFPKLKGNKKHKFFINFALQPLALPPI